MCVLSDMGMKPVLKSLLNFLQLVSLAESVKPIILSLIASALDVVIKGLDKQKFSE